MKTLARVAAVLCLVLGSRASIGFDATSSWLSVRVGEMTLQEVAPAGTTPRQFTVSSSSSFNVFCDAPISGPADNYKIFYSFSANVWTFDLHAGSTPLSLSLTNFGFNARKSPGSPFYNNGSIRPVLGLEGTPFAPESGRTFGLYNGNSASLVSGPVSMPIQVGGRLYPTPFNSTLPLDLLSLRLDFTPIPSPGAAALPVFALMSVRRRRPVPARL